MTVEVLDPIDELLDTLINKRADLYVSHILGQTLITADGREAAKMFVALCEFKAISQAIPDEPTATWMDVARDAVTGRLDKFDGPDQAKILNVSSKLWNNSEEQLRNIGRIVNSSIIENTQTKEEFVLGVAFGEITAGPKPN